MFKESASKQDDNEFSTLEFIKNSILLTALLAPVIYRYYLQIKQS